MSNYALQSEVNRLERELSRLQAINRELQGELSVVAGGASRGSADLENFNARIRAAMDHAGGVLESSNNTVLRAYELQGEIEKLYVRFKNIELANKNIRACNNKKYYDFDNYRTVRKIVQGIMDNLDLNMVSNKVIAKSVETQHLQVPDYWLTCVLISVMAWKGHDSELAERAVERAVKLDKKHSAVFYMLFNLRMRRNKAALEWFNVYQDCELKGSDQRTFLMLFSLVSRTIGENVEENVAREIFAFINKVIDSNAKASGYSEAGIIGQIRRYYNRMEPEDPLEYQNLRKFCGAFESLSSIMMNAKNNINILQFVLDVVNVPEDQKNMLLKIYVDELIDAPNEMEKEVYSEIVYNELIIRHEGDIEKAKAEFDAQNQKAEKELDLIAEMIDWIFEKEDQEVNGQIKLNMFTLTKDIQRKAVEWHVRDYRNRRQTVLPVHIGDYAADADLTDEEGECAKVETFYNNVRDNALAAVKNWPALVGFGIAAAAAAGAFYAGYWLFAGTAIGAGYGVFLLISNSFKRKQLRQRCKENIALAQDVMRKLAAEFREYQQELDGYDSYYERIANEFNKL